MADAHQQVELAPHQVRRPAHAGLAAAVSDGVRDLAPAYFALVMTTGIVSLSLHALGVPMAAGLLFVLNLAAYTMLAALFLVRAVRFPRQFFGHMLDHRKGPGFFTAVTASCIIGSQWLLIADSLSVAIGFWLLGIALWLALTYTIFAALTVKRDKPSLDQGITGAWLLAIVATIRRGIERADRRTLAAAVSAEAELPGPVDVALGRDAVYLDDLADLLLLYLLHLLAQ